MTAQSFLLVTVQDFVTTMQLRQSDTPRYTALSRHSRTHQTHLHRILQMFTLSKVSVRWVLLAWNVVNCASVLVKTRKSLAEQSLILVSMETPKTVKVGSVPWLGEKGHFCGPDVLGRVSFLCDSRDSNAGRFTGS